MTPEQLRTVLAEAASTILGPGREPTGVVLRRSERGDWETNLALRAGAGSAPDVAGTLAEAVEDHPGIASATVSGPGFLTIVLDDASLLAAVAEVGRGDAAAPAAAAPADAAPAAGDAAGATSAAAQLDPDAATADIQLAHAHGRRLLRNARSAGLDADPTPPDLALCDPDERRLLVRLTDYPATIARAATGRPAAITAAITTAITAELTALAEDFRDWARRHRLVPTIDAQITGAHTARLVLVTGLTTVLARGLHDLGASAPERM